MTTIDTAMADARIQAWHALSNASNASSGSMADPRHRELQKALLAAAATWTAVQPSDGAPMIIEQDGGVLVCGDQGILIAAGVWKAFPRATWQYRCADRNIGFFTVDGVGSAGRVAQWIADVEARPTGWTVEESADEAEETDEVVAPVTPDIVVEGIGLAWRDGDDLIVRMPQSASRAQLKAVNRALGATRFRRSHDFVWLDSKHFAGEVHLQVAASPQAKVAEPVTQASSAVATELVEDAASDEHAVCDVASSASDADLLREIHDLEEIGAWDVAALFAEGLEEPIKIRILPCKSDIQTETTQNLGGAIHRARAARDDAEQAEKRGLEAFLALQEARRQAQADYDEVLATNEICPATAGLQSPAVEDDAGAGQEPADASAAPRFGFPIGHEDAVTRWSRLLA